MRSVPPGAALPFAIFSLAVVGALVAAAFWLGISERRAGRASVALQQAFGEAERASQAAVAEWAIERLNFLPIGSEVSDTTRGLDGGIRSMGQVRRLNTMLYLITGVGIDPTGAAVQRVAVLVRLSPPRLAFRKPLLAAGPLVLGPGADVPPAAAPFESYCAPGTRRAGAGAGGGAGAADSMNVTTEDQYENLTDWIARANKVVLPGHYTGIGPSYEGKSCRWADPNNWGDPLARNSACATYLPVVVVSGDLSVSGGVGQGVLVVVGDLTLRGGVQFHGLVLVQGEFVASGTGTGVVGAVQVGGERYGSVRLEGTAGVWYSLCTLGRALAASSSGVPLASRGWLKVY